MVMTAAHICVIEDDTSLLQSLVAIFEQATYRVTAASNATQALALLEAEPLGSFDVLVSDIRLGDGDGIQILQRARSLAQPPEVILLTGYSTVQSAVEALRAGAIDYLLKPCQPKTLLATVERALARRYEEQQQRALIHDIASTAARLQETMNGTRASSVPAPTAVDYSSAEQRFLTVHTLQFDRYTHSVMLGDHSLHLTPTEYSLLLCLAETSGRVLTYSELVAKAYGYMIGDDQARILLKSHIHNLRLKLAPSWIQSVRGIGYLLTVPAP